MNRQVALRIALVLVGLLYLYASYDVSTSANRPSEEMLAGVYALMGVFLLLAIRNPSANRSLIVFSACSILLHAAIVIANVYLNVTSRGELLRVVVPLTVIGVGLIMLAPPKQPSGRASAAGK
jgi:ABC-type uncharacterized transport system permease subunit